MTTLGPCFRKGGVKREIGREREREREKETEKERSESLKCFQISIHLELQHFELHRVMIT